MEKPELTNGCVESPEIEVITSSGGVGQPDGEGLGALLVRVLLFSSSLAVNFSSLLTQSLLNTFKPDAGSACNHSCLRIPMERVGPTPLVKKCETVG